MDITKEMLEELYLNRNLGMERIAKLLNVGVRVIRTRLDKYSIPKRGFGHTGIPPRLGAKLSDETKRKIAIAHTGKRLSKEHRDNISKSSTDREYYLNNGYAFIRVDGHHRAIRGWRVKRAIVVAEEKIGRRLLDNEVVHHINGIRDDDSPDNLIVMTNSKHSSIHCKDKWQSGKINSSMIGRKRKEK